jgi:hypothetical protein
MGKGREKKGVIEKKAFPCFMHLNCSKKNPLSLTHPA